MFTTHSWYILLADKYFWTEVINKNQLAIIIFVWNIKK